MIELLLEFHRSGGSGPRDEHCNFNLGNLSPPPQTIQSQLERGDRGGVYNLDPYGDGRELWIKFHC